jgi:transcriptional regulator GlxA family with amidase domain
VDIAILLFDRLTALDAVGPYDVLAHLPDARVRFVAAEPGGKRTETGMLELRADESLDDALEPDIVLVPGGVGMFALLDGGPEIDWLRSVSPKAEWTTSVCSGSLVLGAAGLLEGKPATSHWSCVDALANYGAIPTRERVVEAGNVMTAAGVSAGIDMALTLAARIAGEEHAKAIQLGIEYDPQPPFPMENDEAMRERVAAMLGA